MPILYQNETYKIRGAIYEVYKELGPGFLESVYQECLAKEFTQNEIPFAQQKEIEIFYKNQKLNQYFKADFICYDKIIIEIKAVKTLEPIHTAQVLNYLKATQLRVGFLVNFNSHPKVLINRIIL